MTDRETDIVVIGGSSGSIGVITAMLRGLPANFRPPIVIVIHRMKNVKSDLKKILSHENNIQEPEDKEELMSGCIYLAPQNYHLLVERERIFSLDYSELVNYSRPSIDVTFSSIAHVYKERAIGIVLSGANTDGANGIAHIMAHGGRGIAQDPATAEYSFMPEAAIKKNPGIEIHDPSTIVDILLSL